VAKQFGPGDIQHLIISDGPEANNAVREIRYNASIQGWYPQVIELPYSVGRDRYNGHRMYAAGTFLAEGDYVMYLDDDNTLDPTHVGDCLQAIDTTPGAVWTHSLRKIVDEQGNFLCYDDCESLGRYHTVLSQTDHLIDVNCYFLKKELALQLAPVWYRKAREPGVMEVDRALCFILLSDRLGPGSSTGRYTVNYAVGGNALSVAPEFFIKGNAKMAEIYGGEYPWRRK